MKKLLAIALVACCLVGCEDAATNKRPLPSPPAECKCACPCTDTKCTDGVACPCDKDKCTCEKKDAK